ncbi:MAG: hypothetical protein LBK77_08855 [Spirochaetaceae bacterium]|jgi:hypothetical protein|nr:hypothetical protein [Spirochaetaceae bacterium]
MAISPIDLQTLFTQADKVGKQEAAQREGAAIQQAIQQSQIQRHTDERIRAVNEAQDMGDGTEEIKDKNGGRKGQEPEDRRRDQEEEPPGEVKTVISDPDLGRNIDVTL